MDERLRVPERFASTCELCSEALDTRARGVHQWTAGWVMQRSGGGGHGVSLPVRENRWAHGECVSRSAAGKFMQGQLL